MADRPFTHSLLGPVVVGVPMALTLVLLVRWSWRLLASAGVGALTHLAWDAFTHRGDVGVRLLPVLATEVPPGVPIYSLLQYASSVLGLLVLALAASRWYARAPQHPVPPHLRVGRDRRLAVLGVVGWVGFVAALRYGGTPRGEYARFELAQATLTRLTIGGVTGVVLAVLGWALLWHVGVLRGTSR